MQIRLSPYLPGCGPRVTIHLTPRQDGKWNVKVNSNEGGRRVTRFEEGPYRPAPSIDLDTRKGRQSAASDVISFAQAYAERPAEFDRDPSEFDQVHADWWRQHGDALTSCLPE